MLSLSPFVFDQVGVKLIGISPLCLLCCVTGFLEGALVDFFMAGPARESSNFWALFIFGEPRGIPQRFPVRKNSQRKAIPLRVFLSQYLVAKLGQCWAMWGVSWAILEGQKKTKRKLFV